MNETQSHVHQSSTDAMEEVLKRIQSNGTRRATIDQIQSLRTLARFTDLTAVDYGYGIDAIRIYFKGGRCVSATPEGRLYS
jgi:hypothetical protein